MSKILDKYQIYLYSLKIKVPALYWLLAIFLASLILGLLTQFLSFKLGIIFFVVALDLGIGIPALLYNKHLMTIEKYWPEALRLIADTMKAGSSFDYALREAASADFGPLSYEFNEVIRRLEMGDTTLDALNHLALRVDSKTVRRTVTLIQECLRTGAQLSEVLEEIANDTKNLFRIKKERVTKTMLQVIFIFAAGGVIAPGIFGLVSVIASFLTDVASSTGVAGAQAIAEATVAQNTMSLLLDLYILIEVFAASAMISIMRDGKLTNLFLYFPVMIVIAYIVFSLAQFVLGNMITGMV
jgi:archaellum biogenesis protein FlaJ (TadC family)